MIGGAEQGGLGLPDRDYYTKTDDKSKQIRQQYEEHVAKMLALSGDDSAKASAEAKTILDLETKLAEASLTRVERRDPVKTYHKMSRSELRTLTPNWSWENYFQEIGYTNIDSVDVSAPKFFEGMSQQLKDTPLDDWKTYLRWHLVNTARAVALPAVCGRRFQFQGTRPARHDGIIAAMEALRDGHRPPAWAKRSDNFTSQKYFPPQAKARALDMVNQLIAALRDDLTTLPWMSPATRKQALDKACRLYTEDRVSRQVARLLRLSGRPRPLCAQPNEWRGNSHSSAT